MTKILVVGYGNMAHAIVKALLLANNRHIFVTGRNEAKVLAFCNSFTSTQNFIVNPFKNTRDSQHREVLDLETFDEVLLCIKPYGFSSFVYQGARGIVYSVMAGVCVAQLRDYFKEAEALVRIMPNIGAFNAQSASCVYIDNQKHPAQDKNDKIRQKVAGFIQSFGNCVFVDNENLINASIATSGSSPAFLALVAQSLIDCGVYSGLSLEQSQLLVKQTFKGFSALLEKKTPQKIIESVTSPSGTTSRGLACLERHGVRGIFIQAGLDSISRAEELANTSEYKDTKE